MGKKIAIVHDVILEDGGAESVLLTLAHLFPEADVYTSFVSKKSKTYLNLKKRIQKKIEIKPYFLKFISFIKPFMFAYWERMNFNQYEVVISSTHSFFSKAIITSPLTKHVCYCYTPPRFLYGYETEFAFFKKFGISQFLLSEMRYKDFLAAQRPDIFLSISKEIQSRIKKFYRRDSQVIYPPVRIPKFRIHKKENYFICISRLVKPKRLELAILACNKLKEQLYIVGDGPEKDNLLKLAQNTIHFCGKLSEIERDKLLQRAKGFLFCSENEDFGIAPVEALGFGVPIIAYKAGGPLEYLKEGVNGLFFSELSVNSLTAVIRQFNSTSFNSFQCYDSVKQFKREVFERSFLRLINQKRVVSNKNPTFSIE